MLTGPTRGLTGSISGNHAMGISGNHAMGIGGTVILMKKEVMEFNDLSTTSIIGYLTQFLGTSVSLQLVSATVGDPNNENKRKLGDLVSAKYLSVSHLLSSGESKFMVKFKWVLHLLSSGESKFKMKFKWDASYRVPCAVIVKSLAPTHFLLKTVTMENFPRHGPYPLCMQLLGLPCLQL